MSSSRSATVQPLVRTTSFLGKKSKEDSARKVIPTVLGARPFIGLSTDSIYTDDAVIRISGLRTPEASWFVF